MSKYFDKFPKVPYRIDKSNNPRIYDMPTDVTIRLRVLIDKLDSVFHYYEYTVKEGETPEILAHKYYGDSEAHWLILMSNNIIDPYYDWPMGYDAFNQYITNKYGSIDNAQTTVHHYLKVFRTIDNYSGTETIDKVEVTYDEWVDLPTDPGSSLVYSVGQYTVSVYPEYRDSISCYDFELEENEKKRSIKLIRKDYYPGIVGEFEKLMNAANASTKKSYIRRVS